MIGERKDILVLGSTYPTYSVKYEELACTGGLIKVGGIYTMIRLFPINYHLFKRGKQPASWQWISAEVVQDPQDLRPESWRVNQDTIQLGSKVESMKDRADLLDHCASRFRSVEALNDAHRTTGASMGVIRPAKVLGYRAFPKPASERAEWDAKERQVLDADQGRLFGTGPRRLTYPDHAFEVSWLCDDPRCKTHTSKLRQWGIHELARKYDDPAEKVKKVEEAMMQRLDQDCNTIYFMIGNFAQHPSNFGLMDTLSVKGDLEPGLFPGL